MFVGVSVVYVVVYGVHIFEMIHVLSLKVEQMVRGVFFVGVVRVLVSHLKEFLF